MIKTRWGIFAFYNVQGIVARSIINYLDNITKYLDRIIIVCNGKLEKKSENLLRKYTDEIIVRENIGGDAGAYQHVILNYLNKNEILSIDELLLFNDTMFGPFVDMEQVFYKMENEKIQFWGITQNDDVYLPSHIQSYFIGIKKEMLKSDYFIAFWKDLDINTNNLKIVVCNFEIGFTYYFQKMGFSWETLVGRTKEYLYANPFFFLKERQVPFIKRKSFGAYGMSRSELEKTIDFIQNNTNYPIEYIYNNIKREYRKNVFNGYVLKNEIILALPRYSLKEVLQFLEPYKRIFIYGLTIYGICLAKCVQHKDIEFAVSDEYYNENCVNGIKVNKFSKLQEEEQSCLVVTLSLHKCEEIKQRLNWHNVIYYF